MKACKTVINLIVNLLKFITCKIMYTKLQLQQAYFVYSVLQSTFWSPRLVQLRHFGII